MVSPDGQHGQQAAGEIPRELLVHAFETSYENLDLPDAFGVAEQILDVDSGPLKPDEQAAGLQRHELPPRDDTYDSIGAWESAAHAGQDVAALMHERNTLYTFAGSFRELDGSRGSDSRAVGIEVVARNERGGLSSFVYSLPDSNGPEITQQLRDMVRARGYTVDTNASKLLQWAQRSTAAVFERMTHLLTADNNELAAELGIHSFGVHDAEPAPVMLAAPVAEARVADDQAEAGSATSPVRPEDAVTEPLQVVLGANRTDYVEPAPQQPVSEQASREEGPIVLNAEEALAILRQWRETLDPIDPAVLAAARDIADRIADGVYVEPEQLAAADAQPDVAAERPARGEHQHRSRRRTDHDHGHRGHGIQHPPRNARALIPAAAIARWQAARDGEEVAAVQDEQVLADVGAADGTTAAGLKRRVVGDSGRARPDYAPPQLSEADRARIAAFLGKQGRQGNS